MRTRGLRTPVLKSVWYVVCGMWYVHTRVEAGWVSGRAPACLRAPHLVPIVIIHFAIGTAARPLGHMPYEALR